MFLAPIILPSKLSMLFSALIRTLERKWLITSSAKTQTYIKIIMFQDLKMMRKAVIRTHNILKGVW